MLIKKTRNVDMLHISVFMLFSNNYLTGSMLQPDKDKTQAKAHFKVNPGAVMAAKTEHFRPPVYANTAVLGSRDPL